MLRESATMTRSGMLRTFALGLCLAVLSVGISGQRVLRDYRGSIPGEGLGRSVRIIEDIDGDEIDDIIVESNLGLAVRSGADGGLLLTVAAFVNPRSFDDAGDVDGDAVHDIVWSGSVAGVAFVEVVSGTTGAILYSFTSPNAGNNFGSAVAGAGDVDGDGRDDIVVGQNTGTVGVNDHLFVYSGATGAMLHSLVAPPGNARFGDQVAGVGDMNVDGYADVAVSSPDHAGFIGRVRVYSGQNGNVLHDVTGAVPGESLGLVLRGLGDVDDDGFVDFAAGGFQVASVFSGATGDLLHRITPPVPLPLMIFPADIADAGDWNDDGRDDFAIASWEAPTILPSGIVISPTMHGAVAIYDGQTGARQSWFESDRLMDGFGDNVASGRFESDPNRELVAGVHFDATGASGAGRLLQLFEGRFLGSGEDLRLVIGAGGNVGMGTETREMSAGTTLSLRLESPRGGFDFTSPILAVDVFSTGSLPPVFPVPAFPEVHLRLSSVMVLVDGPVGTVFGPTLLTPGGNTWTYALPAGLNGISAIVQGFAIDAGAANGFFAAADAFELVFE